MPANPRPEYSQALDRLDEIHSCWSAIADLISPETDLQAVDRDDFAILLGLIEREENQALTTLRELGAPGHTNEGNEPC